MRVSLRCLALVALWLVTIAIDGRPSQAAFGFGRGGFFRPAARVPRGGLGGGAFRPTRGRAVANRPVRIVIPRKPPRIGRGRPRHPVIVAGGPIRVARPTVRLVVPPRRITRGPDGPRPMFVVPVASERRYRPREILVLTTGPETSTLRPIEAALGLRLLSTARIDLLGGDIRRYALREGDTPGRAIAALRSRSVVAAAEPNYLFELQDDAASPSATKAEPAPLQYAVGALHLSQAHALAEGDDVRVAVIDSGIDETNPELAGMVADRFDAVGGTFAPHAHGTAMGGAIVAHQTLVGTAPKARLIAIRAFSGSALIADGMGYDILRGLDFAATHGARIVNMSFAGPQDLLLKRALDEARRRGIVTIAAAGNGGPWAKPQFPAAEPGVIAVTATDADGKAFALANRGAYIALAAPGVQIMAPSLGHGVQFCSGTSIATAEVSGVVALLMQRRASASPDEVRGYLSSSARRLAVEPEAGGAGQVDAEGALRAEVPAGTR